MSAINPQERIENPDLLQTNNYNNNKNTNVCKRICIVVVAGWLLNNFLLTANRRRPVNSVSISSRVCHTCVCQKLSRYFISDEWRTLYWIKFYLLNTNYGYVWFRCLAVCRSDPLWRLFYSDSWSYQMLVSCLLFFRQVNNCFDMWWLYISIGKRNAILWMAPA